MEEDKDQTEQQVPFRQLIRNFFIEIAVYGILLVGYFFIVIHYLRDPLIDFFNNNLVAYAVIGLGLLVAQAVVFESITSLLFDFLGLHRLHAKPPKH